jgi:hypothetical protein
MGRDLAAELASIDAEMAALEERRAAIYRASVEAPDDEKVCLDAQARALEQIAKEDAERATRAAEQPMVIRGVVWTEREIKMRSPRLVAIRPCDGTKTYVGIHIGNLPIGVSTKYDRRSGVMEIGLGVGNPAVVVPMLGKIVFGYESWWGPIESEDDLKQISDEDIENVWYVKAMRKMLDGAV